MKRYLLLFVFIAFPALAESEINGTDSTLILNGKKAITSFLRDNEVIVGAPKWSYQVAGTHHPWALIIKSEKGIYNCYLTFEKTSLKDMTCDLYLYMD